MRLLAVGDMHLGRIPVALPEALAERAASLGPEVAWRRCVDLAIADRVEAVLLAGDVVDRERDFFAGYASLKSGIERLLDHGIRVIAVAGNHDTEVLPRLADALAGLELIGRGGRWQGIELSGGSIIGWSFPQRRVTRSPLESFPDNALVRPVLGLLHCDLDQADSVYAPVRSSELEAAAVDAWLLGHIHLPSLAGESRPIGYLGSVTALRASEIGLRGPWRVDVEGSNVRVRQVPMAPLAFDALDLDAGQFKHAEDLDGAIITAGRKQVADRIEDDALPDALGLRIRLNGEHPDALKLAEAARAIRQQPPVFEESGCQVFVDRIDCLVRAPLDLEALARQPDPAGVLARDLLLLAGPDCESRRRLVAEARERLQSAGTITGLHRVATDVTSDEAAARLARVGHAALIRLLEQQR